MDIDFVQKVSTDKSVKTNHETETDLQAFITDFTDLKNMYWKYLLPRLKQINL